MAGLNVVNAVAEGIPFVKRLFGSGAKVVGNAARQLETQGVKQLEKQVARSSKKALEGAAKSNFDRFVKKIPANSRSSVTFKQLEDGNYLFKATSPGRVLGSKAVYQKWVTPQGETFKMIKTTFGPDGKIIHVKPK